LEFSLICITYGDMSESWVLRNIAIVEMNDKSARVCGDFGLCLFIVYCFINDCCTFCRILDDLS